MNNTVKLGLIMSVFSIITSLIITHLIDPSILFTPKFSFGLIGLTMVVLVLIGRKMLRDPEGDRLSYGQAVMKLFLALLISIVIGSIFAVILYGGNEEMKTLFKESLIKNNEATLTWTAGVAGIDEVQLQEQLDDMRQQVEDGSYPGSGYPFTWAKIPINIGISGLTYFLLSLLMALFVREKETQYA